MNSPNRPRKHCLLLIAGALLSLQWTLAAAEPLGRLFFTPERRAALERQRQFNIQETRTLQGGNMRLDGVVRRSSGHSTVWVNGQIQHDRNHNAGVFVELPGHDAGKARLSAGDEAAAELKVGESINRATRETEDGLNGGSVSHATKREAR
jgi:hypothetical protein